MDSNDIIWTILDNPITSRREIYWIHTLKFFITAECLEDLTKHAVKKNKTIKSKSPVFQNIFYDNMLGSIWEDIKVELQNDVYDGLKKMPAKFTPGLYVGELRWISLRMMKSLIASKVKLKKVEG